MSLSEKVIKDLLEKGTLLNHLLDEMKKVHAGDIKAMEVLLLCAVGRKVKNRKPYSFNVLFLTKSSSGKDHAIRGVLKLFRKDDVWEKYGRISETALNYLHAKKEKQEQDVIEQDFDWSGKILYLPEITNKVLNNEVMKEFTSGEKSDEISEIAITKRKSSGVDIIRIKGKPEVFCSSAKTIPSEEIRNRFNIVGLDLTEEQTESIFRFEEGVIDEDLINFLSDMKEKEITIPKKILNFMIKSFPKDKIRYRRDFQRLKDFVMAHALLYGRKIAIAEDYNRGKDVFVNAFSSVSEIPLRDVDEDIIKVLEKSQEGLEAREIHKDIENGEKFSLPTIYNHLNELEEKEIIQSRQERIFSGYLVTKYNLTKEFINKKPFVLPTFEDE